MQLERGLPMPSRRAAVAYGPRKEGEGKGEGEGEGEREGGEGEGVGNAGVRGCMGPGVAMRTRGRRRQLATGVPRGLQLVYLALDQLPVVAAES